MTTRRTRAAHEAGHVLANHRLGWRVERVSIEQTGSLGGYCLAFPAGTAEYTQSELQAHVSHVAANADELLTSSNSSISKSAKEIEDALLISLSGPEAETRYSQRINSEGAVFDLERARELLSADSRRKDDWIWDLAQARTRARQFVTDNWKSIEAVAYALECSGTLTGHQVRLLITSIDSASV